MRYCIIQADGMADEPLPELGGRTPLEAAHTPYMNELAARGVVGTFNPIPSGMDSGSDVGTLSVLGYDPAKYYTGRAPIEAAGLGLHLERDDVAYRMNLVTVEGDVLNGVMKDYSAGHISPEAAATIVAAIKVNFETSEIRFFKGLSYRHIMVWRNGPLNITTTPPHDITDRSTQEHLPRGNGAEELCTLMAEVSFFVREFVSRHCHGDVKANAVWFWGQGRAAVLPPVSRVFGGRGAIIAAVDLVKGIGALAGMDHVKVRGATGDVDTNYSGKGKAAVEVLEGGYTLCMVHVEAPDEAGHRGDPYLKKETIELIDAEVVAPVLRLAHEKKDIVVLVTCDHRTPCRIRTHATGDVPFVLYHPARRISAQTSINFCEKSCRKGVHFSSGEELINYVIDRKVR